MKSFPFSSLARWGSWAIVLILSCAGFVGAAEKAVEYRTIHGSAVFAPMPTLYNARLTNDSCTAHMVIDPASGRVTNVYAAESSCNSSLNYRILEALRRWKFRPGSPKLVSISFGTVTSWHRAFQEPERQARRMDDVLAPFLGKGTVVRGELQEYPATPAWTNKRGTGVFELHVNARGRVSEVTIKRSSGDPPFDEITVKALRKWRFRRGPLIIELPLSFVLTETKFSVRIPKHR